MTVFLDTVGLLALWDENDQWHAAAMSSFAELQTTRADLITTTYVLLECGNAAARRPYRGAITRLRHEMALADKLISPSEEDLRAAWAAYESGKSDGAGIVDLVSFEVMRRLKLTRVFTNDRHFRSAGFETLF